ncbi:Os01g0893200 [Oryza sativa Japonica Group]|uniref:Os01g0893200 protein n=1 Tax=Oryza sativa subsp. japonica TaxID=39947 RepID=A0A0P0VBI3_ORYSJ|nr:uncharacterized protein LOC112939346 [Oryza sativa Japonica Group]BAS75677.1 Os01g0893200 [Oryza sativa Japonica Group]
MASAGGHGDDGDSGRRPPADPALGSNHKDEVEAAANQRRVEDDGGEFYSLRSWGELVRRWLRRDDGDDDDDSFFAMPAWRGCAPATATAATRRRARDRGDDDSSFALAAWRRCTLATPTSTAATTRRARARGVMGVPVTAPASTVRSDASTSKSEPTSTVRDDASASASSTDSAPKSASLLRHDASGTYSAPKSASPNAPVLPFTAASDAATAFKSMPPDAYAAIHALILACSKTSDSASASPPMPPEAYAALHSLMLACSKASNTASASAPPMPPEAYAALHALVLACSKASDTASASPPPPPDAHALAFTDLLSSSTRLATSLTNSQVSLAAPADHLAHSMSILAEKIVEGSNGLEEAAANVKNAASTLLVAADNPKASEELAGESRDLAARILQLIHDVEDQAREDAAGAKFTDQDVLPGCEQCADRSCLCPWLFGSCTSPSGGCSTSQPRRAVDEKQETLRDKWTTFFTFSMPASLAVLPLLEKHISQGYSALLGYSYGAIFFSAAAGLLLSMNATADSDVQVARYLGNLSVLALSVLVMFGRR